MICATLQVTNRLGLHARAASQLVRLASKFNSRILLSREGSDQVTDARSILQILMLAASQGTRLKILADGQDEFQAVEAVRQLFEEKFGEEN